jgi:putrescine transport system substrate-binding protein
MHTIKKLLSGALGLALGCALPALHAEEKNLRLYNWADYFAEDTLAKFTAETGINVIYDVMDGSETLEAKMLAGGSGYDLIFPGDTVAERLMRAGSLQPLDTSKLTALDDIEPGLQKLRREYEHSSQATVPYTWGTVGLTYNAEQIKQRMPDAPVNSLDMLFKPELAAKFADCGISLIDSPDEMLAVALNYLGRDPRSSKPEDLAAASELLMKMRPYIRKFQSQPVSDLVNRQPVCVARLQRGYDSGATGCRCRRQENYVPVSHSARRYHGVDGHHGDPRRRQASRIRLCVHQLRHAPGELGSHQ